MKKQTQRIACKDDLEVRYCEHFQSAYLLSSVGIHCQGEVSRLNGGEHKPRDTILCVSWVYLTCTLVFETEIADQTLTGTFIHLIYVHFTLNLQHFTVIAVFLKTLTYLPEAYPR